jgi:hypothetical protein
MRRERPYGTLISLSRSENHLSEPLLDGGLQHVHLFEPFWEIGIRHEVEPARCQ